jgi:hypothetical protein
MFQLYDHTRRRISIALFVLLAIVPTVGVVGYAAWLHTAAHVRFEADRLGRQLGVTLSLKSIRHLTPTKTVYEGVQLSDAERGRTIFSCTRLEALWRNSTDGQGKPQPSLLLTAGEAQLDSGQSQEAWLALNRFLARQSGCGDVETQFSAPQLALRAADGSYALQDVQVCFHSAMAESWVDAGFQLAQTDMPNPVRFCLWRTRRSEPPVSGFSLDTGSSVVPCKVLPAWLDVPGLVGPQSLVRGCVRASRTEQGWSGEAKGQLWDVELDRLVSGRFPHTLRGSGQITIESAQFRQGRLDQLQGKLLATSGVISGSLLDAAVQCLSLAKTTGQIPPRSLLPYDDLTLAFLIDNRGLQIRGRDLNGPILSGPQGPLLQQTASSQQPMPVAALLQTLIPVGLVQVPASPQAAWLLERLPCSAAAAPEPQIATKPDTGTLQR